MLGLVTFNVLCQYFEDVSRVYVGMSRVQMLGHLICRFVQVLCAHVRTSYVEIQAAARAKAFV